MHAHTSANKLAVTSGLRPLTDPLIDNNPITLQILGLCSALAVTTSLINAAIMAAAMTGVLACSSTVISMIRHHLPSSIRIIVQVTIIASLVIVADQILKAFAPGVSRRLTVFVGLIVTNCIVLARAEAFASQNPVGPSLLDGLGHGLGYSLLLLSVGAIREFLGSGSLLGYQIMTLSTEDGWYVRNGMMLLPPAAFFVIGLLIWAIRTWKTDQLEMAEYRIEVVHQSEVQ